MKLSASRPEEPQLNLTPLIDVVFLLLIFFMVSTTFNRESEIAIDLPEASGEVRDEERFKIEIAIDAEGRYYINQEQVINTQIDTLKRALRKVRGEHQEPQLIITADRQTPHQAVITAMDAARQVGLTRLTFATQKSQDGTER